MSDSPRCASSRSSSITCATVGADWHWSCCSASMNLSVAPARGLDIWARCSREEYSVGASADSCFDMAPVSARLKSRCGCNRTGREGRLPRRRSQQAAVLSVSHSFQATLHRLPLCLHNAPAQLQSEQTAAARCRAELAASDRSRPVTDRRQLLIRRAVSRQSASPCEQSACQLERERDGWELQRLSGGLRLQLTALRHSSAIRS